MKTDTTLFEIYSELGILELMQSEDVKDAIAELCEDEFDHSQAA